ncbi:hypothetical protein [Paenibacillus polymyxa]
MAINRLGSTLNFEWHATRHTEQPVFWIAENGLFFLYYLKMCT